MADLAKLVEELSALTVLEAAELSKMLEEKWGVSAAAPVAVAAAPVAGAAAAPVEEQTEFQVILAAAGDKKALLDDLKRMLVGYLAPLLDPPAPARKRRAPGAKP